MYVKKFASFCQVLKEMHTEENWLLFSASQTGICVCFLCIVFTVYATLKMSMMMMMMTEVVNNKENLAAYEPSSCALQYPVAADKPCSPASPAVAATSASVSTKSLAVELARRAAATGSGAALTDSGNIYTEPPPPPAVALRRCQSLLDTATATTASSWQRPHAPAVTSSAQHHCTCKPPSQQS